MNEKKKTLKDQAKKIADDLETLVFDDFSDEVDNTDGLPPIKPVEDNDYDKIKNSVKTKADKAIDNLLRFYLSADIIENEKYIKIKSEIDKMTLSSLMFQLEAGERALVTLLKTIDSGELQPRMFEVLSTLQKSMLDIIKSQTLYLIAAEESTKKLSRDLEIYQEKMLEAKPETKQIGHVHRGAKDLMKGIQGDFVEVEENNDDEE